MARRFKIVRKAYDEPPMEIDLDLFTVEDTEEEIPLMELLTDKLVSLYSLDHANERMVFVRVPEGVDLVRDYAFYHKAQSASAEEIYIARYEDCFSAASKLKPKAHLGTNFSYVFNTGRCGSTLLHKLLLRGGVCSLSEPEWTIQIMKLMQVEHIGDEATEKLLECCHVLAFWNAKLNNPQATFFSMNPKAHTACYFRFIPKIFPSAKFIFLSRECSKVVESFSSIMSHDTPQWQRSFKNFFLSTTSSALVKLGLSRKILEDTHPVHGSIVACTSNLINHEAFLPFFGRLDPLAYMWTVNYIVECAHANMVSAQGLDILFTTYEEMVASKPDFIRNVWKHLGISISSKELEMVLEGFGDHSQKDDKLMSKSSNSTGGPKFLSDEDRKVIAEMLQVPVEQYLTAAPNV
eukprot:CAMPEP_0117751704 /NCGR_PEP_ID=MMETSP0947-20121206/11137_1 /TAXON_ID=44440 /ORGANISM="Chattonella subsalsa, Strain CCMP2191" /LENGTH=406 /DNA_ID=CAMNT_0005570143 /DNA_START=140 /DNA_END=1360 /DNA_ORIENTATION=-